MKATFTIPLGTRPELLTNAKHRIPAMSGVQIDTEKRVAAATNGCAIVVLPIEMIEDPEMEHGQAVIPGDAVKEAQKITKAKRSLPATFDVNGDCVAVMTDLGMRNGHKVIDGQFPRYEACIPMSKTKLTLALDAKLLLTLAQALGVEKVTIEIPESSVTGPAEDEHVDGAMIVRPYGGDSAPSREAYGAIMPCAVR